MAFGWQDLRRLFQRGGPAQGTQSAELERLAALKRAAQAQRDELAADSPAGDPSPAALAKVREAESAYAAALTAWENRNARQPSR